MSRVTILILSAAALSAAIGQLLFRVGARGRESWVDFINLSLALGFIFYGVGTVIWIYALSRETLVNVYAFTALTFVLVYLGGVFLLGERLNLPAIAGIGLVLSGLYLITKFNA